MKEERDEGKCFFFWGGGLGGIYLGGGFFFWWVFFLVAFLFLSYLAIHNLPKNNSKMNFNLQQVKFGHDVIFYCFGEISTND